ncbi:MAG: FadR/GntR family transcriptional regulator [Pseudomonadota bacterium]
MTTIHPLRYRPLYEQVVELIEARIIDGDFRVGDQLPTENELAAMYMVSRTVIREANKILKEKGWVETRTGRGTFLVNNMAKSVQSSFDFAMRMKPEDRFSHLIEVRLILEPEIASLAAVRANADETARMQLAVSQMDKAITDGDNIDDFLKGDFAFHMALAESTGNPLVRMIIDPVVSLMRDFQEYHLSNVKGGKQRSQHNHKLVMEAIKRHDPEAARLRMYEHILQVRADVMKQDSAGIVDDKFNHSIERISG